MSHATHRILVLDDDQQLLEVYQDIFSPSREEPSLLDGFAANSESIGEPKPIYQVTTATQGEEGVERVREALADNHPFQVAFVDIRMPPGIDGLEAARRIRAMDDRIYIVIVTAYSDRSVDEIQESIRHDVLLARKPLTREEILQLARNACNSWREDDRLRRLQSDLERQVEEHAMARWYLENLVSSLSEGLLVCTGEGLVTSVNPATVKFLGRSEEALLGSYVSELFPESDLTDLMTRILHQGPQRNIPQTFSTQAGKEVTLMVSGSILQQGDASGLDGSHSLVLVIHQPSPPKKE
ncbi:MAG: response regulator [Magnetococcales bacterium]|nr:response regulator [Magnetococcales bacterium]